MGDCELIRDGLLAQPVNTLSSLAFVVAAFYVRDRPIAAVALAWVGVGSVLFHGWPGSVSTVVHDSGVLALVIVGATLLWRVRAQMPWPAVGVFAFGALVYALSRTDGPLCRPSSLLQGHAVWHIAVPIAVVMLVRHERQAV